MSIRLIIFLCVWFPGCVLFYRYFRRKMILEFKPSSMPWTVGDRWATIFLSITSWFGFIVAAILKLSENKKPARW
jgi:hypothetical protein